MNEVELAQNLGEAFRKYSDLLRQGQVAMWRPLMANDTMEVVLYFNKTENALNFKVKETTVEPSTTPPKTLKLRKGKEEIE